MTRTDTRFLKWGDEQKHHPSSTSTQIRLWRIQCARLVDPIAFAPSRHQHIRCLQHEEDRETWGNEGNVVRIHWLESWWIYESCKRRKEKMCPPPQLPTGYAKIPLTSSKGGNHADSRPFPLGIAIFSLYICFSSNFWVQYILSRKNILGKYVESSPIILSQSR